MSQLLWSTLGIVCPTCDEHNAPRAAKCTSCGTALLEASPAAKAPAASPARAPGGTNPKLAPVQAPAAAPKPAAPVAAAAKPAASVAPTVPAVKTAPGGSNPRIPAITRPVPVPVGKTITQPTAPAVSVRPADAKAGAIPPGMRPSARVTPAQGLPPAELEIELNTADIAAEPTALSTPKAGTASKFSLTVVSGSSAGQRFRVPAQGFQVGRGQGAVLFPDDPFVSTLHASFSVREGKLYVRDENSTSGVFVTVPQELLPRGSLFAAGNHLFRYTGTIEPTPPPLGRPVVYGSPLPQTLYLVEEILVGGRAGRAVVTHGPLLTIGQSLCDLAYPGDDSLAARHCEVSPSPAGALLRDLSGGLGTYVHLSGGERALNPGDRVRIGDQVLQVELAG